MELSSLYFFGDKARLVFGDYTPNETGLFCVQCFLVAMWAAIECSRRNWKAAFCAAWLGIAVASLALAMTFSRGAYAGCFVAIIVAVVASIRYQRFSGSTSRKPAFTVLGAALILSAFIFAVGGHRRVISAGSGTEASTRTRREVWRSTVPHLGDIALRPEWRRGTSGEVYTNWLSPIESHYNIRRTTSTPIDALLDFGIYGTLGIVICLSVQITIGWFCFSGTARGNPSFFLNGLTTTLLVSTLIIACTSSLWAWEFYLIPMTMVACELLHKGYSEGFMRVLRSFGTVLVCVGTLSCLSAAAVSAIGAPTEERVRLEGDRTILGPAPNQSNSPVRYCYLDEQTLGPAPGRRIRRWMESGAMDGSTICPTLSAAGRVRPEDPDADMLILFGRTCRLLNQQGVRARNYLIVLPRALPPRAPQDCHVHVILGDVNEEGSNQAWIEWATQSHFSYEILKDCGLYVREDLQQLLRNEH